jgi:hypothetical protein
MPRMKLIATACIATAIALAIIEAPEAATVQSREALWASCRKQVFRKYGHKYDGRRYLPMNFSVQATNECVRNGGRVR